MLTLQYHVHLPSDVEATSRDMVERLLTSDGPENVAAVRAEMQESMEEFVSVMRDEGRLLKMREKLAESP